MQQYWYTNALTLSEVANTYILFPNHNGLYKIPAPAGGPGSDIIKLGITIGGQKLPRYIISKCWKLVVRAFPFMGMLD